MKELDVYLTKLQASTVARRLLKQGFISAYVVEHFAGAYKVQCRDDRGTRYTLETDRQAWKFTDYPKSGAD